ncbi:MAG: hypothetical protein PF481_11790 [Bacteroidales bacterium]|jgi:hypothetical protein|nr:hypothetical protein [Bacteroidales bacterium]
MLVKNSDKVYDIDFIIWYTDFDETSVKSHHLIWTDKDGYIYKILKTYHDNGEVFRIKKINKKINILETYLYDENGDETYYTSRVYIE